MKKICVFTGTRAEYGLLVPLLKKIKHSDHFELQLLVSGMHLSPEFGLTYKQIEEDGFEIDEKVEILLSSDTDEGISKSIGLGVISFTDSLSRLNPDMVVLLGDRYESLAFAIVAHILKIPISHLHGGEKTEGLIDEAIRHSITKMSYLHFTSTEEYKKRVIQLGENPEHVYNVGAIGIDNIVDLKLFEKIELENLLDFKFGEKNILVTYHPTTLEKATLNKNLKTLFTILDALEEYKIIITKSNSDMGGRVINQEIDKYVKLNPHRCKAFFSLGTKKYLSVVKNVDIVLGNSSSGIIEVPSLKKPTVNIGDRQKGRIKGNSVIDCSEDFHDIFKAIKKAERMKREEIKNPYGTGDTSEKIFSILKEQLNHQINLKKEFYDLDKRCLG